LGHYKAVLKALQVRFALWRLGRLLGRWVIGHPVLETRGLRAILLQQVAVLIGEILAVSPIGVLYV